MRDKKHYLRLLAQNPNAGVGFALAAAAVFAARHGTCEPVDHSTDEFRQIARDLKARFGETLTTDEVRAEMEKPTPESATRTATLPVVRVTPEERDSIVSAADAAGMSLGAYIRRELGLD